MLKHILGLLLALLLLSVPSLATAPTPPAPAAVYCPVEASATPNSTPGFYTVTVSLAVSCPPGAVAEIHLSPTSAGPTRTRSGFRSRQTARSSVRASPGTGDSPAG